MKKIMLLILLVLFVAGCAKAPGECTVQTDCAAKENCEVHCVDNTCEYDCVEVEEIIEEPVVEETPVEVIEEPEEFVVEPVETLVEEVDEEPFPGYTQAELDKYAKKDMYPMDLSDPRQYLSLSNDLDLKRISTDRGEFRSLTFTVRNLNDEPINVEVQALFLGFEVSGKPAKVEKQFDIPQIPPGFKFMKKFPQTIYFEDIEETKTIELYLTEKYTDPSTITQTVKRNFVPYDEMESLEITW